VTCLHGQAENDSVFYSGSGAVGVVWSYLHNNTSDFTFIRLSDGVVHEMPEQSFASHDDRAKLKKYDILMTTIRGKVEELIVFKPSTSGTFGAGSKLDTWNDQLVCVTEQPKIVPGCSGAPVYKLVGKSRVLYGLVRGGYDRIHVIVTPIENMKDPESLCPIGPMSASKRDAAPDLTELPMEFSKLNTQ